MTAADVGMSTSSHPATLIDELCFAVGLNIYYHHCVGDYEGRSKQPDLYIKPENLPLPTIGLQTVSSQFLVKLREDK